MLPLKLGGQVNDSTLKKEYKSHTHGNLRQNANNIMSIIACI